MSITFLRRTGTWTFRSHSIYKINTNQTAIRRNTSIKDNEFKYFVKVFVEVCQVQRTAIIIVIKKLMKIKNQQQQQNTVLWRIFCSLFYCASDALIICFNPFQHLCRMGWSRYMQSNLQDSKNTIIYCYFQYVKKKKGGGSYKYLISEYLFQHLKLNKISNACHLSAELNRVYCRSRLQSCKKSFGLLDI